MSAHALSAVCEDFSLWTRHERHGESRGMGERAVEGEVGPARGRRVRGGKAETEDIGCRAAAPLQKGNSRIATRNRPPKFNLQFEMAAASTASEASQPAPSRRIPLPSPPPPPPLHSWAGAAKEKFDTFRLFFFLVLSSLSSSLSFPGLSGLLRFARALPVPLCIEAVMHSRRRIRAGAAFARCIRTGFGV